MNETKTAYCVTPKRFFAVASSLPVILLSGFNQVCGTSSGFPCSSNSITGLNLQPTTGTPQYPCNTGGGASQIMMSEDESKIDNELTNIIDEPIASAVEDFSEQVAYKKKEYAYETMLAIPDLINSTDRASFMDSMEQNNIGKLKEVEELIHQGDTSLAEIKNSLVNDTNLFETNIKTVNSIYLTSGDTLTASDSLVLDGIAITTTRQGGKAVHWARGRLRKIIEDAPSALRKAHIEPEQQRQKMKGKLFPLPATELVTFSYDHYPNTILTVSVTDVLGKRICAYELKQNSINISVSKFAAGFYYVKVCEDGLMKEEYKLTIIR